MTKQKNSYKLMQRVVRFMLAMVLGAFVSAFSFGALTARAEQAPAAEAVVVNEEQTPAAESVGDNAGAGMFLLMGGMLIIIIAVVVSVVGGTVASSVAIADEV